MGRPKGDKKYWNEVIIIVKDKKWKCNHCQVTFSGGFSRIKAHLDKTQGKGISKCPVYLGNEGVQHIITSTSIHPQEAINTLNPLQSDQGAPGIIESIDGSIYHQVNIESSSLFRVAEDPHEMINGGSIDQQNNTQSIANGGSIDQQNNTQSIALLEAEHGVNGGSNNNSDLSSFQTKLNKLVSDLRREEHEIMSQLQFLESHCKKPKDKEEVDTWLNELHKLKIKAIDMNNSLHQFGSTDFYVMGNGEMHLTQELHQELQQLTEKLRDHVEQMPLVLSNEFVGEEFEEYVHEMWELLEDDLVLIIGIHGMGGVGKTFLATFMENDIKTKGAFNHVFWVTVSQDCTIFKLQLKIAERIGVKLCGDDERNIATILASELEKLEKAVLILDDVWKYIDLQKVGIPLKVNGIKLIITTRLIHVCQQMDCLPENMIEMKPLHCFWGEEIFLLKLGHHGKPATLPPQVLEIARSVVEKCDGLPLGISVMARTMKGRDDIVWWRRALYQFRSDSLEMGQEMEEELLTVLKRSYDNLIEKDLQKCFLHCALFQNYIGRDELVMKLIQCGMLNRKRSLRELFDEGHIIVNKLIDHSLLFLGEEDEIEMNGLVRMMAWHILKQSHSYVMVKCCEKMIKIPHLWEWRVDLEAVSLADNNIKDIPEGTSPNCPRLSTFILSYNEISHIPECLFTRMNALTLLDLSYNLELTCLPNSVSNLRSLTSLVLRGCSQLEYIPPLGALQALSTLDISCCSIKQVPEGLEKLLNLKLLDLYNNSCEIPGGVLSSLTNIQYLDLRSCSGIGVQDVKGMSKLEYFAGTFLDLDSYNCYVQEIQDMCYGPHTYLVNVGQTCQLTEEEDWDETHLHSKLLVRRVEFYGCEEMPYLLPRDLAELSMRGNKEWVCLCSALKSNGSLSLRNISIRYFKNLESLFCLSSSCSLCKSFKNLESLDLYDLDSLTAICKQDAAGFTPSLSTPGVFFKLKHFQIYGCQEIELLFTHGLVLQLQNLQSISVSMCKTMKEIFAESNSGRIVTLPKLTKLTLFDLPQLTTVCNGTLVCGSEYILRNSIYYCPNLKNIPKIEVKA